MDKFSKIEQRVYNESMPLIYPDFKAEEIDSWFAGYSSNHIDLKISPTTLYKCTKKYNYINNQFEHFTSLKSIISILNSNTMRMYNMDHLKDQSEYLHATPRKYHNSLQFDKKHIYLISGVNTKEMTEYEIFNLWEKYGEEGNGAKIKFEIEFTNKIFENDIFLKRVIYEKLDLSSLFIESIKKIEETENVSIDFKDILSGAGILHKHPQYTLEREIRLGYFNEFMDDSIKQTPNLNNPFFEDYSYNSRKVSKYRNIKINDSNELINLKIVEIELGYKHKIGSDIYWMLNFMSLENHSVPITVSILENI